jgi:AraC-like DNA-binding protein
MQPIFEKVTVPGDSSWTLLNRRLDDAIPFEWHYHPEFELTLTLNSRGQRHVGDHLGRYDDGDLVLVGPNLPHTWCSQERIDPARPHIALVMWFSPDWAARLVGSLAELRPVARLLDEAGRGLAFSAAAAAAVRPAIEAMPDLDPASRLLRLIEVLTALARDDGRAPLAAPAPRPAAVAAPEQARIDRVLNHIHANYRDEIPIAALTGLACLSPSAFHRFFRRHTRLTVSHYVAQLRIGQACSLLINSDRPIAHVADEVGYPNIANFNRQFRALKAMTPREFRRSFQG